MAGENTLNYREQGGDNLVIGGTLTVAAGGKVVPDSGTQPAAIADHAAAVGANPTKAEYDALVVKFNSLLAALRGLGVIAT